MIINHISQGKEESKQIGEDRCYFKKHFYIKLCETRINFVFRKKIYMISKRMDEISLV